MKTVIINGSYKAGGQCERLINLFNEDIGGEIINLRLKNIAACEDCGFCGDFGSCRIRDDMDIYYKVAAECDVLVIASPIYFASLTGSVLDFFSRFQCYYLSRRRIKRKKGIVILTGGGSTNVADLPERQAKILLSVMNCEYIGKAAFMKADKMNVEEDEEITGELCRIKNRVYGRI